MKELIKLLFLLFIAAGLAVGCGEEPIPEPEAPELTQKVNKFMKEAMDDYYLWYKYLPDIDYRYEFDSKAYFDKLLYEKDKWSYATDDVEALENSFEGKEESYGWSLAFGKFENTGDLFAIIEFVYPNTPASEAGLTRGDVIIEMNNSPITQNNYRDLFSAGSITVTLGVVNDGSISAGSTVNLTARELILNPVVKTNIVEHDGHRIGYIFYAQFIENFNEAIDTALQRMNNEQITDLVLDLRYNPGGMIRAAQHLCSSVAPRDVVNENSKLVTYKWNDKIQRDLEEGQVMHLLEVYFDNTVPIKLGLDNIHILTGPGTASASELTITGLRPYMNVTTIGESTYGKYTASITLKPEDIYKSESYYKEIDNWAIQPIVIRYANAVGVTDFEDGFAPDVEVKDELLPALPLGDMNEPLFKAAIENITGTEVVAMKSVRKADIPYTIFDRGFSEYDRLKNTIKIDRADLEYLKK